MEFMSILSEPNLNNIIIFEGNMPGKYGLSLGETWFYPNLKHHLDPLPNRKYSCFTPYKTLSISL